MKKMIRFSFSLLLCCGLLFTAFSKASAQNVPVYLTCYPNLHIWEITFNDNAGGYYVFQSTDKILDDNYLGSIPTGTYTVEFNSNYSWQRYFEYTVTTPSYDRFFRSENYYTVYNVIVDGTVQLRAEPVQSALTNYVTPLPSK